MKLTDLRTIEQLREFLSGTQAVAFSVISDKDACYRWIQRGLVKFPYLTLSRQGKGLVIGYLMKISGYSRQQLTRLIAQYRKTGRVQRRQRTVVGFKPKYTQHDEKTRPRVSKIGERRKPQPNGHPGYIRIDTVHQGDLDQHKGVYHINAVDEVTQFEVVCGVEKISERYLIPALEQLLQTFPFTVRGFHSDNGSEYINKRVAKLLEKLRIEFTKSRSRQSNDYALAESKNGAVLRKLFGYSHIPQRWAPLINGFNQQHSNPYLNFHRPCFFPETRTDDKGKQRKIYRYENMMTPYDKLKSLPLASEYLKPGLSFERLDRLAYQISDNQAADQLQKARQKLFKTIHGWTLKTG